MEVGPEGSTRLIEEASSVVDARVDEFWVTSRDGAKVHAFHVHTGSGPRAIVVHGYGGFRISLTPTYTPALPALLRRGIAYVVANLGVRRVRHGIGLACSPTSRGSSRTTRRWHATSRPSAGW